MVLVVGDDPRSLFICVGVQRFRKCIGSEGASYAQQKDREQDHGAATSVYVNRVKRHASSIAQAPILLIQ